MTDRFRLARIGVLNVWQYDEQIFELADGRLLLRGANGAGKSKTLEMLLPFVIDGDKSRMTASARHHTSLLWLMLDGYAGQNRVGYLWVEFRRATAGDDPDEVITCGVGIRASQSARTATAWYFTVPGRIGGDLWLEDDAGPLPKERLRTGVEALGGRFFESARQYKQHVGQLLFGLDAAAYDELLRLLYWLRQPQVGEDIEPARLAGQLVEALPALDDEAVRAAGDTFDELAAFGEQLDRRRRSAGAITVFAGRYAEYARQVLRGRGSDLLGQHRERSARSAEVRARESLVAELGVDLDQAINDGEAVRQERAGITARLGELRADPALRTARELLHRREVAAMLANAAGTASAAALEARRRADDAGHRVRDAATGLARALRTHVAAGQELISRLRRLGGSGLPEEAVLPIPAALHEPTLGEPPDAEAAAAALDRHGSAIPVARRGIGGLIAAVDVVSNAEERTAEATAQRSQAEEQAAEAERQAEEERGRLEDAARETKREQTAFTGGLELWLKDPAAAGIATEITADAAEELTAEWVAALPWLARRSAARPLALRRAEQAQAGAARTTAEEQRSVAVATRKVVAQETDPAPAEPSWARDPRTGTDGGALWRLVDFDDRLGPAARAGLEAALQASGLLDAWVRADGQALEVNRFDLALSLGAKVAGPSLDLALRPDPPADSPVPAEVVRGVLGRIAWHETGPLPPAAPSAMSTSAMSTSAMSTSAVSTPGDAAVCGDGSWRIGPLTGRAGKAEPQYVGATAREAERRRRLAEIDATIERWTAARDGAAQQERQAEQAAESIESWLSAAPDGAPLLAAWTRLDERRHTAQRSQRRAAAAEEIAVRARATQARLRTELDTVAARHGLPVERPALADRRDQLVTLDRELGRHHDGGAPLAAELSRWAHDAAAWTTDVDDAEAKASAAAEQRERAEAAQEAADELADAIGADVEDLQRRILEAERREERLGVSGRELENRVGVLRTRLGAAQESVKQQQQRVAEMDQPIAGAVARLVAATRTPGLLDSGLLDSGLLEPDRPESASAPAAAESAATGWTGLALAYSDGDPVPAAVLSAARQFAGLAAPARPGTETSVYAAWQEATSGPAGDCEPRIVPDDAALAVVGRDDTGEYPIHELATRLASAVARDSELLTERERQLFEEHVLGGLGESLRALRQESEELVAEMNALLRRVTTSQGIQVQLRWALREDVSADTGRAVALLGRPTAALLPDERRDLTDALHRLIEASRLDAPEDSYTEHLSRALDYRRWYAFRIRYTRPESAGSWHDLHRRSPLSQGEQKVVCYLPLFAAAAAHFSSLTGAAPHSPRFVLLDDAFPKIDVRTHPLLFGLLVQLDLDFVVTSERLWGDHETVPSLAIYEALRDPTERGIAQYRYRWDGHRLSTVEA